MNGGSTVQERLSKTGHEFEGQIFVETVTPGSQLVLVVAGVQEKLKPETDAHDREVVPVLVELRMVKIFGQIIK